MADPAYRVFLSHSSKDEDFVRELYLRLTRDGVSCFFEPSHEEPVTRSRNGLRVLEADLDNCRVPFLHVEKANGCEQRTAYVISSHLPVPCQPPIYRQSKPILSGDSAQNGSRCLKRFGS